MPKPSFVRGPKIKRLFWDIEVTPNLVWSWRVGYKINLQHENIVQERKVICIGYKWEGERHPTVLRWDRNHGDRDMLAAFIAVANQADELVAQYGDGFDLPWFRTRCLILGLEPLPLYKTIDTKAWASKYFYFNSNKLDYLADVLGFGKKLETKFQLWIDVMNGSKKALDYMCKYCGVDVVRLQQVYSKLAPCVRPKTHAGVFAGKDKWSCSHCGSENVAVSKKRVTASGTVQWQMRCNDCGSYFTISNSSYQEYLKAKTKHKKK
jgi:hypothetical protein